MRSRWFAGPRALLAGGLALALATLGEYLRGSGSTASRSLLRTSYDSYYAWFGLRTPLDDSAPVLLVYLDAESFAAHGLNPAQPWPRALHAQLVERLTRAGARAVVFDIVFDSPGPNPAEDAALAKAFREHGRVVLAAEAGVSSRLTGAGAARMTRLALPVAPLRAAAAGWGLGELSVDEDFVARRHFRGMRDGPQEWPSLSWATARVLGLPAVPAAEPETRWLRYYGRPLALPHVSYRQALEPGGVPDASFRDKVVLVGARPLAGTFQSRRDELRSPYRSWRDRDLFMPGVEVHATQLLNLLRNDGLRRPGTALERAGLWAMALGSAGLLWLRPLAATGVVLGGLLGWMAVAVGAFVGGGYWFPWLIPAAVQAPLAWAATVLFYSVEWYRTRRRLEAAQRAADIRIRQQAALIDKARDAIVVLDLAGRVQYANPAARALYGLRPGTGGNPDRFLPDPAAAATLAAARERTLECGEWDGPLEHRDARGQRRIVESRWTLIRDDAGRPQALLLLNTDVTEQRQLQAETLRLQRMEGIGALAAGMAHDLNNALAPVLLGAQLLRRTTADPETRRVLTLMEESARRGAEMVRQVLLFARGRGGDREPLRLGPLLKEIEKLVRDTFPPNIRVVTHVADDLWPVRGNVTELHQVLLNLCVNARDAMPHGGTLSLVADNLQAGPADLAAYPEAQPGAYVVLMVCDTGPGIPPEVLPHLFEPFFTTKPPGQGTGLGLSTVNRIVRAHGGFIRAGSGESGGATFEILLPRLAGEPAPPARSDRAAGPPRGQGELILVADDEQAVRELMRRGLEDHGYRVLAAAHGAEAVALFEPAADAVALLVTDTAMPFLDGPGTVAALRRRRPNLPVLLLSGAAETPAMPPGVECLAKPFELPELLARVARALGR